MIWHGEHGGMAGMAGMAWALGMGTHSNSSSLSGEGPE